MEARKQLEARKQFKATVRPGGFVVHSDACYCADSRLTTKVPCICYFDDGHLDDVASEVCLQLWEDVAFSEPGAVKWFLRRSLLTPSDKLIRMYFGLDLKALIHKLC